MVSLPFFRSTCPDSMALDNQAEAATAIIPLLESNVTGHAADQLGTITPTLILGKEMQNYENEKKKEEEEKTNDNGLAKDTNPVLITDLDEENGDFMMILGSTSTDQEDITNVDTVRVNIEEFNKRIEEFIRKMKEELKIEAQQQPQPQPR